MRIAFILPSLEKKGPVIFTKYLVQALKGKVSYIKVFYFREIVELDFDVPVERIRLYQKMDFDSFDIVHSHMLKADLYCFCWHKLFPFNWVSTTHNFMVEDLYDLYPRPKALIFEKIGKHIFKRNQNLIMSSAQMKCYYNAYLSNHINYKVIPYGIPRHSPLSPSDSRLKHLSSRYVVIGSSGSLIQRKGFEQLLGFLEANPNFALIIVGEGPMRGYLSSLARDKQLGERFLLLGFKQNPIDYYTYFDIYAMTSYSEGFGLSLLEAMSQSLPIVCSDLKIYQDFFSSSEVGMFKLGDKKSLENAILRVSQNTEYFGRKSHDLYLNFFSLEAMGRRHLEYYIDVIANQGCAS